MPFTRRRKRAYLPRILLPFFVGSAVAAAAVVYLIVWLGRGSVYVAQVRPLVAAAAAARGGTDAAGRPSAATAAALRKLSADTAARITLVGPAGTVTFDTADDPALMENHNARPEVLDARRLGLGSDSRVGRTLGRQAVYLAERLDPDDPAGPVVRVAFPDQRWAAVGAPVWAVTLGTLLAGAVTVAVVAAVLQRQWITPTQNLTRVADRMAAGHWDARVDPAVAAPAADDVRTLADRMNRLADNAQQQLAEINRQSRDLHILVDTLPDPILVTDAAGRVDLANAPAAHLLRLAPANVVGQQAVAVVDDTTLLQLLHATPGSPAGSPTGSPAGSPRDPAARSVRLVRGGRTLTYQAVATPTAAGGVLLLLRDVSNMADTLQMKTDFVANASHELRTPIAAIKIALETLTDAFDDDPDYARRCAAVIAGHVQRLEDLLRDLLDLSRLESPDARPALTDVGPWDLFAVVRSAFGPSARLKDVDLRFADDPATPDRFTADERLLHLILKNLVENSLKFTPPGGTVTVRFQSAHPDGVPAVLLTVADTGSGIPPEHQVRVFERFYQVDPARSGTAGRGTGLGLAIVKHAVAALGGTVRLDSTVGLGTTVTCLLPQTPPPPKG